MLRWRNLKIGLKYGIALSITIFLFVLASGLLTISFIQIKDSVSEIEVTAERSIDLTQMSSLFRAKDIIILDYSNTPRESLISEYEEIEKEFTDLQTQIEPKMDTNDLKFIFDLIKRNNKQLDDGFKNDIIPNMQQGKRDEAIAGIVKISGPRTSTIQLFDTIKVEVDKVRARKISSAYENIDNSTRILVISIILALIFGSAIVFFISRGISLNLKKVVDMTDKISKGDLNVESLKYKGKDEIGQLSESINKMLHKLQDMIREITESSNKVDEESNGLKKIASEVQQSSEQIASTMEQMSAGAEEQASSATEIANSIYNLTELIEKANSNKEALQISSKDILVVVHEGTTQMNTSIGTMNHINDILKDNVINVKQLEENSGKVTLLVNLINSIAEQTNLLALNAAIEAARAGEAGRGFAVVSDEIRKLAEQVAKSVKEITSIVTGIQTDSRAMTDSLEKGYQKVQEGTGKIKTTGELFVKINSEITTMVERINNVSENLDEISLNSKTINTAGDQIAAISEENSAGIQETVASVEQQNGSMEIITENANSLADSAELLKQLISQFKV
jgi:methyl-accepting chemotaxis protein